MGRISLRDEIGIVKMYRETHRVQSSFSIKNGSEADEFDANSGQVIGKYPIEDVVTAGVSVPKRSSTHFMVLNYHYFRLSNQFAPESYPVACDARLAVNTREDNLAHCLRGL